MSNTSAGVTRTARRFAVSATSAVGVCPIRERAACAPSADVRRWVSPTRPYPYPTNSLLTTERRCGVSESLRDECLEAAHAENREVAATADLWIRKGFQPDELPYVLTQLARINDYILAVIEAEETRLGRELVRLTQPLAKFAGSYSVSPTIPPRTA